MARWKVAVGGFQHETNTFAPAPADWAAFLQADSWPELQRGAPLLDAFPEMNVPVSGFIARARQLDFRLVPLAWSSATPSAHVTRDAFERMSAMLLEELSNVGPVDAVYLDLHGAMVAEHLEDGEGEILARVRRAIGPRVALVASLDLHANVTERMMAEADLMVAYRTYPHVDMAETGARAAQLLAGLLMRGDKPEKALRRLDFLIPLTSQCTLVEPAAGLYRAVADAENAGVATASFCPGFAPADIHDCAPTVFAFGGSTIEVNAAVDRLASLVSEAERAFGGRLWQPDDAVRHAMAMARGPVVLADAQDNPGAGGNADTVGLLSALIANGAERAALGNLYDPAFAAAAHKAGIGAKLSAPLGAKSGQGETPLSLDWTVEALSDGSFEAKGPFYAGARISLGATALVRHNGVRVVVASKKVQCADRAMFRHIGVEPEVEKILAVKSSVHFRADFGPIASEVLVVEAPGPSPADHTKLTYRRLAPGRRLMPLGPAFVPPA
jgi:microcystin degradation protein MlrC